MFCCITQNSRDLVPYDVHSMELRCQMKFLASIYTISERRGLGFQPRTMVGADRDMGGAYRFPYRGKLVPTGFPGVDGRRYIRFQNRGKLVFCVGVCS